MNAEARKILEAIGIQLDQGQCPLIYNGGMVKLSTSTVAINLLGEETFDVPPRASRSTTRSRQWAAGRQRPTDRPRSPGRATPFVSASLRQTYREELNAIHEYYPGTKMWFQDEGMWLKTESLLVMGLGKKATFLAAVPFVPGIAAKGWGYWTTPLYATWIGPRHTNFPDGSICAFEPRDNTWNIGDSLVKLIDLYTLWAFRHLHLEVFGQWPGYQSVPFPYERIQELHDNEHCGCDQSHLLYAECCKPRDLQRDTFEELWKFLRITDGGTRCPPQWVLEIIQDRREPPSASKLV